MHEQRFIKVTLPDGKSYEAPAESEMEIREVYSNLPPSEQIRLKIEPIYSGEERMRIAIEEQNEIERLKAEIAELKAKQKPTKTK